MNTLTQNTLLSKYTDTVNWLNVFFKKKGPMKVKMPV